MGSVGQCAFNSCAKAVSPVACQLRFDQSEKDLNPNPARMAARSAPGSCLRFSPSILLSISLVQKMASEEVSSWQRSPQSPGSDILISPGDSAGKSNSD